MKDMAHLFILMVWLAGIVLAKGVLSTVFAIIFPLWGLYLVVERIVILYL